MMTEPIVLDLGQAAALLWHHVHERKPIAKCATCDDERDVVVADREVGFCRACLDRSRIVDGDEIGGES